MQSTLTLTIDINHPDDLPFDAQGAALMVGRAFAAAVFPDAGRTPLSDPVTFGRRTFIGSETPNKPGVQVFLQSAAISRKGR